MHIVLIALLAAAGPPPPPALADDQIILEQQAEKLKTAVLGIQSGSSVPEADRRLLDLIALTDDLRNEAPRIVPGLGVMTKESMQLLIEASGQDAAKCEGLCAVDLGRLVNADYVTDGLLSRAGGLFVVSFSLYETQSGRLLSGVKATGADQAQLAQSIRSVAPELFGPLKRKLAVALAAVRAQRQREADAKAEAEQKEAREHQLAVNAQASAEAKRRQEILDRQPRTKFLHYTGLGLAGASLLAGAVVGLALADGSAKNSKITDGSANGVADVLEQSAHGQDANGLAKVAGITGGVLLGGGLLLYFVFTPLSEDEVRGLSVQVSAGPTGMLVAGRF